MHPSATRSGDRVKRLAALCLALLLAACRREAPDVTTATYVGRAACVPCHAREDSLWRGSQHAVAMQPATDSTVLGDFHDATFTYFGQPSRFFRQGGKFMVRTEGADGNAADFEIAYTFGVYPLQQYLIAFPGGRYQMLGIAWDSRPRAQGGQRWFHLYPTRRVAPGDPLHWTAIDQTWNYQCAECHSTNLRKGYDAATNTYHTTWSEIHVACEACHGPASAHVAWARANPGGTGRGGAVGLVATLADSAVPTWVMDTVTGIARRSIPRRSGAEVETCARCHARRGVLNEDFLPGRLLAQTHRPALLEERVYEADGQMLDEDYNYASFLQSRMYAAGVTCSDCHDPHNPSPGGDASCARCHLVTRFATPAHHHHREGSTGAGCVACHMAARTYMVVDPRHDHSFRRPRPDLTVALGTPNTCNDCHRDRSAGWAAQAAARWYPDLAARPHFARALAAGRRGLPEGRDSLVALVRDTAQPGVVRATAVSLLGTYAGNHLASTYQLALWDRDPLVRAAAAEDLERFEPAARVQMGAALLEDSVRLVRIAAARALADVPAAQFIPAQLAARDTALAEYRAAQMVNADRPEARLNLGNLALALGDTAGAEREYRTALALDSSVGAAWVNLADLYRQTGRDHDAEPLLRHALTRDPRDAGTHHALGLLLVRVGRRDEALGELARAAALAPAEARYGLAYGLALLDRGRTAAALAALRQSLVHDPADPHLLYTLATLSRDAGDRTAALEYARRLVAADPDNPNARGLLAQLEGRP
jgi:tetratricopeptide (TPR) repeat protein